MTTPAHRTFVIQQGATFSKRLRWGAYPYPVRRCGEQIVRADTGRPAVTRILPGLVRQLGRFASAIGDLPDADTQLLHRGRHVTRRVTGFAGVGSRILGRGRKLPCRRIKALDACQNIGEGSAQCLHQPLYGTDRLADFVLGAHGKAQGQIAALRHIRTELLEFAQRTRHHAPYHRIDEQWQQQEQCRAGKQNDTLDRNYPRDSSALSARDAMTQPKGSKGANRSTAGEAEAAAPFQR